MVTTVRPLKDRRRPAPGQVLPYCSLRRIAASEQPPAYAYSISRPGNQTLDPIIVVDR